MAKFSDADVGAALLGRRAIRAYPFPGLSGVEVGIRALSDSEVDEARRRAQVYVKEKRVELVLDPEFLDRAIHRFIVLAACFDIDKSQPFFASHDEVLQLDQLTVRTLYELYNAHVQSLDPLAFCPAEEVESVIAQLGKSESVARLTLFDRPTLVSFVLSMASMLRETPPAPK